MLKRHTLSPLAVAGLVAICLLVTPRAMAQSAPASSAQDGGASSHDASTWGAGGKNWSSQSGSWAGKSTAFGSGTSKWTAGAASFGSQVRQPGGIWRTRESVLQVAPTAGARKHPAAFAGLSKSATGPSLGASPARLSHGFGSAGRAVRGTGRPSAFHGPAVRRAARSSFSAPRRSATGSHGARRRAAEFGGLAPGGAAFQ